MVKNRAAAGLALFGFFLLIISIAGSLIVQAIEGPQWLGITMGILFVAALLLSGVGFMWVAGTEDRIKQAAEDPKVVLRERVNKVNTAFAEATSLMEELRRDLDAQQAARDALLAQAEEQQKLLEIDKEQAEKIRQILVGETKAGIRAGRRRELRFFVAGILLSAALSIPIGIWVNSIS